MDRLVLSRTELMRLAPAEARDAGDKAIDSRVARLRAKLETAAIVTVRGRGYMFVPPHQSSDYTVSG
jgi:DNA-binding response OmpR family regulator